MRKNFALNTLSVAVLLAASGNVLAIEAASIDLGGVQFTPTLEVSERYDDNFREVGTDEDSSWITSISPTFVLAAKDRVNLYSLTYALNSETYHSFRNDDNVDHHLDLDAHMEFSSRSRLDLNAGYDRVEQTADTETEGVNDKYHTYNIGGVYGYGAKSATMQLDFGANHEWKRYDNEGGVNDDQERDTTSLSATAYYRVAPKTRALAEVRYSDYDYVLNSSTLDSDAMAYLLGVTWEATAKTSGTAKFGWGTKEFDDASKDDADKTMWEVGVTWEPRTYSAFTLETNRYVAEGSEGAENYIDTTSTSVNWNHQWSSFVSSDLNYAFINEDYENDREDDTNRIGAGLTYELRRWMSVGVGYQYKDVDSNVSGESYDRNQYQVTLTMGL
ncbi:hypothetical protein GCM10011352_36100 [Marinobacterium zhoushanense]|uniref:Beta-barrel porin 2 n=1 Tax=Marinobacterium zhoushanense TaxID=1679163 RepID=A0ABQ1KPB3_9GAMM|nr:outer membrane beta-barrel protein [Marinobacterium zhoushanense]GGC06657.1 hypothetical protein GCM10011352_36100 [Marinobacterium zhoushanense]